MRINYNASAMRANNALNVTDNRVSTSLQRLSSGLKINRAKDNPSGYAIGRRMDVQIAGVAVATKNANTGISVIQTADGALTEVHDMLQRMNELAVKGSTGTLTSTDREILNQEVVQLKKEIARVAQDTEFNGQPLLDGSFDLKGYTNNLDVKVGYYSDEVLPKVYTVDRLDIVYSDKEAGKIDMEKCVFQPGAGFPPGARISSVGENSVTITDDKGFKLTLDVPASPVNSVSVSSSGRIPITNVTSTSPHAGKYYIFGEVNDPQDRIPGTGDLYRMEISLQDGFSPSATVTITTTGIYTGDTFTIDDPVNGIQISGSTIFGSDEPFGSMGFYEEISVKEAYTTQNMKVDITGIGAMDTQIGANEGQILKIRVPTMSLQRLGITNVSVETAEKSDDANVAIKSAIQYVSDARSRLGAYQNRLEHTISNLDITSENMTASYSRIMDVDMAEEMTYYTTQQVVEQAAISMLAQANERPSQVLQLLQ